MKRFFKLNPIHVFLFSCVYSLSSTTLASGFQLWEQDGASIGLYHAGYAAWANDASTAYYNPAGITRFPCPQGLVSVVGIEPHFKYRGSVDIIEGEEPFLFTQTFPSVTDEGGTRNVVPAFHYVSPLTDRLGFGLSVVVPFGLETNYGRSEPLRYAATLSHLMVVDASPSLGYKFTEKSSIGAGFDVAKAYADFNSIAVFLPTPEIDTDTKSLNKASDTGYGFHVGWLYQFTPCTRIGISYHSRVVLHLEGTSNFVGPIADAFNEGQPIRSDNAKADLTLPPFTAFSIYNRIIPQIGLMGSVIYTQWNTFKTLRLRNVAGLVLDPDTLVAPSKSIVVTIPEHYRNSWNFSVGSEYYATNAITLRGALGYDQTPVRETFRNVQLPDNDRYIFALGGHYQPTPRVGIDLGYTHFFVRDARVNPPPQVAGAETVITNGRVHASADVYGGQIVINIV